MSEDESGGGAHLQQAATVLEVANPVVVVGRTPVGGGEEGSSPLPPFFSSPPSPNASTGSSVPVAEVSVAEEETFVLGQSVASRYQGGEDFFEGVITAINADATVFEVRYSDGEIEKGIPRSSLAAGFVPEQQPS